MEKEAPLTNLDRRLLALGGALGVVGIGLAFFGAMQAGSAAMQIIAQSYLYGWVSMASITLGCFSLSLLFHMTRGRWATPLQRLFEAGGGPVPLLILAIAFIPIAFIFRHTLYDVWIMAPKSDLIVHRKDAYLNEPGWMFRTFFFLGSYALMAGALQTWQRKEEKTGDPKYGRMRNNTCAVFMVWYILTMTFLMTDVLMSLDPHWFSTIFPITFDVSSALMALTFCIVLVLASRKEEPYKSIVEDKLMLSDFGNLILMFVMIWTYFTFSQLLIIWSGNLPSQTAYYRARMIGYYGYLGGAEAVANFALPFVALLNIPLKRNAKALGAIATFVFITRVTDLHYLVMPFIRVTPNLSVTDAGCLALLIGIWLVVFAQLMRRAPLIVPAFPSATEPKEVAHA